MKKMFFAVCGMLPGGTILAVMMLLFVGCARLQYQDPSGNVRVNGLTASPEAAMVMAGEAETQSAQAYALRRCADEPQKCHAAEISQLGPWGAYSMDTPAGYTWAGMRAAGAAGGNDPQQSGDIKKDIAEIKKTVRAVSKWQDTFTETVKNTKKGN